MSNHVNGQCGPQNMSFEDLELHDHFDIFFLGVTEVTPGQIQQPITNLTGPWDDFRISQGVHCSRTVNIHVRAQKGYYFTQACTKCT